MPLHIRHELTPAELAINLNTIQIDKLLDRIRYLEDQQELVNKVWMAQDKLNREIIDKIKTLYEHLKNEL